MGRDLIVEVSGSGATSEHNARLQFDGKTSPDNPTMKPAHQVENEVKGTVLIKPYQFLTEGQTLRDGEE